MNRLLSLEGQTAIVTGVAAGIGRGIARRFTDASASIVIADRDVASANQSAETLGAARQHVPVIEASLRRRMLSDLEATPGAPTRRRV